MISVVRPAATAEINNILHRRHATTGLTELEAALWHFANMVPELDPLPDKPQNPPEFAVYSHDVIKDALRELFEARCGYCESRYEHVSPMDVEHYRPKGAVIESDGTRLTPGYYWLAADWSNLLPSCIGCNRSRSQVQILPDGTEVEATSGKGNLFPILQGTTRDLVPGAELYEQPLLLDPCRDNPQPHLMFSAEGFVEPRASPEEEEMPRGWATIEVCGLYRASLVESRKRAATQLREAMESVLSADDDCRRHPSENRYINRLKRREEILANLVKELDYRALSAELLALFDQARHRIQLYFQAEKAWRFNPNLTTKNALVVATRGIIAFHSEGGFHKRFILELYGLADIPLDRF